MLTRPRYGQVSEDFCRKCIQMKRAQSKHVDRQALGYMMRQAFLQDPEINIVETKSISNHY